MDKNYQTANWATTINIILDYTQGVIE